MFFFSATLICSFVSFRTFHAHFVRLLSHCLCFFYLCLGLFLHFHICLCSFLAIEDLWGECIYCMNLLRLIRCIQPASVANAIQPTIHFFYFFISNAFSSKQKSYVQKNKLPPTPQLRFILQTKSHENQNTKRKAQKSTWIERKKQKTIACLFLSHRLFDNIHANLILQ